MKNETKAVEDRIVMRPVVLPDDEEFLIALYYTTRDDIQMLPIDEEQKRNISLMQYLAQKQHYTTYYHNSLHNIVLFDETPVGRLWTARYETEIVGIDLAILPEYRNYKIGTKLMQDLFDESAASKRIFNFHVLKSNTNAMRFYERLNCKLTGETPTHYKMQWRAENELIRSTQK
jgi:ribosomal protein S18 acetylase RimI-like enzyme